MKIYILNMKIYKYIFICAAFAALASCGGKKDSMGPEAVVESFCRAVAAGDFCTAREFCDSLAMDDYLENYQKAVTSLQKEDSCAFAIAAEVLAGAEFEVIDTEKSDEGRIVHYRLAAGGNEKSKKATVKKEEGEWKVTSITDAI